MDMSTGFLKIIENKFFNKIAVSCTGGMLDA
jgi:hypothetical protein